MAELIFFTGPMDAGKSTLALQLDHTHRAAGKIGLRYTRLDRRGPAQITSRLGLSAAAIEVTADTDFWEDLVSRLTSGERADYLIVDEAQFYTSGQIDQLARIADELDIDVFAFGILTDFTTELFAGSKRLVELCNRIETPQVQPLCWCGQIASHNARLVAGHMVVEGDQMVTGDTESTFDNTGVQYETLCRRHHRRRLTRQRAHTTLSPEPLPFSEEA